MESSSSSSSIQNQVSIQQDTVQKPVKEYLYKILVVGDLGTGKTSIIKRYVHNIFSMNYKSTIGVDFALKVLQYSPDTVVRMQLWDIAGQERFGNMTRVYYKEAVGAVLVYDITRPSTFEGVSKWKADIDEKVRLADGSKIPVILLANKVDLKEENLPGPSEEEISQYVKEKEFIGQFDTSAKANQNVSEAFRGLVSKILQNDQMLAAKGAHSKLNKGNKSGTVRLGDSNSTGSPSRSSCC